MPGGVTFQVIRNTLELLAAVPLWTALWRDDPHASPFQSPEWLFPWWNQFGNGELRAVVVARDGVWIGFLPFFLFHDPYTNERQLLQLGASATGYLDGLFAPSCTASQIREALSMLLHERGWDVFFAAHLPANSRLFHAVRMMPEGRFSQFEGECCSRMRAVSLAELPQKMRRYAMHYRNRAQRAGTLELRMADSTNWAEAFGALRRLHTERWLERGETGVLVDERVLSWHCEALPLLEQSGLLRLSSLRLDGEIIGVLYSLVDPPWRPARAQYFYLAGFSTQFGDLHPGTLLIALAIERAAREGIEIIDMLHGREVYKQFWQLEWNATRGFATEYAVDAIGMENFQSAA
jgi:CelD/BcsL family acetyltransferase involved in cellulose biosynthesis